MRLRFRAFSRLRSPRAWQPSPLRLPAVQDLAGASGGRIYLPLGIRLLSRQPDNVAFGITEVDGADEAVIGGTANHQPSLRPFSYIAVSVSWSTSVALCRS